MVNDFNESLEEMQTINFRDAKSVDLLIWPSKI